MSVGERGACDEADKPENLLQRRFSGGSEGEAMGDNEAGIELVSLICTGTERAYLGS